MKKKILLSIIGASCLYAANVQHTQTDSTLVVKSDYQKVSYHILDSKENIVSIWSSCEIPCTIKTDTLMVGKYYLVVAEPDGKPQVIPFTR